MKNAEDWVEGCFHADDSITRNPWIKRIRSIQADALRWAATMLRRNEWPNFGYACHFEEKADEIEKGDKEEGKGEHKPKEKGVVDLDGMARAAFEHTRTCMAEQNSRPLREYDFKILAHLVAESICNYLLENETDVDTEDAKSFRYVNSEFIENFKKELSGKEKK